MKRTELQRLRKENKRLEERAQGIFLKGFEVGSSQTHAFWEGVLQNTPGVGERTREKLMQRARERANEAVKKGEGK